MNIIDGLDFVDFVIFESIVIYLWYMLSYKAQPIQSAVEEGGIARPDKSWQNMSQVLSDHRFDQVDLEKNRNVDRAAAERYAESVSDMFGW